jgi:hypothetical protein
LDCRENPSFTNSLRTVSALIGCPISVRAAAIQGLPHVLGAGYALIMAGDQEYGRKLAEKALTLAGPATLITQQKKDHS